MLPNEKQTASLIAAAERDIVTLEHLGTNVHIADEIWGFHAQQATEKLLKAILIFRNVRYPFVHNLEFIAEVMEQNGVNIPSCAQSLLGLTPYAAELRYTETSWSHEPLNRLDTLAKIKSLRTSVREMTSL